MTLNWQKLTAWWQADIGDPATRSISDDGTTYRIFPTGKQFELWVWSGPAERSGILGMMGSDLRSQHRAKRLRRYPTLAAAQAAAAELEAGRETSGDTGGAH